jgi:hypothetical protein
MSHFQNVFPLYLCVRLRILSSEYQLYSCGKDFSHAMILNENLSFAKGSEVIKTAPYAEVFEHG